MRGQSIHHIVTNNMDEFNVSEKTLYRYVAGSMLSARNIDMPRVCRIKPRKVKATEHKVDKACRIGRTYKDFTAFIAESNLPVVEMDSVIGRVGGKVLLTMHFKSCDFMLAFLREKNTSQSVIDVFDGLYEKLDPDCFKRLFPVLLGDNGSEFSNPKALEDDSNDNKRTNVYYCEPYSSFQKPNVELNHEFIRRILPKGKSFDGFVQEDISLMMSHINSYSREKFNDRSPIDVFSCLFGENILEPFEIRRIPPNEILLKPSLFRKK
jgi:IS30 family transposase